MNTEDIIKLAFDLGNAIAESEEIQELKKLQQIITQDTESYDLIIRYQDSRTKLDNKLNEGLIVSSGEENHLNILEQQLNSNTTVQNLMQAQEKLDHLMQSVYFAMNQAISGEDCSSGCDSCGGSCS